MAALFLIIRNFVRPACMRRSFFFLIIIYQPENPFRRGRFGWITKINKASVRIRTDYGQEVRVSRQKICSRKKEREYIEQLPLVPAYAVTFLELPRPIEVGRGFEFCRITTVAHD